MKLPSTLFERQILTAKTKWSRLAKREQIMVAGLLIGICALFFFSLVVSPLLDTKHRLEKSIAVKQKELQTIKTLQQEYQLLQQHSGDVHQRLLARSPNFTLFSFIEQQAAQAGVKEQINYIKPGKTNSDTSLIESRVDMKLQQVTLEKLVNFLQGVESRENVVFIARISIQQNGKGEGYLNAVLQLLTYTVKAQK